MPGQDAQFIATPLSSIKGVAEQTIKKLARLDLHNIYDLLLNLPFRFEDRTYISSAGTIPEENVPCYLLLTIAEPPRIKQKVTEIYALDHEGTRVKMVFFHISPFLLRQLNPGTTLMAWGHLRFDMFTGYPKPVMTHPEIRIVDGSEIELPVCLSPVYHLTAGLNQERMREITNVALMLLARHPLDEFLPRTLNRYGMNLTEALIDTHNPVPREDHGLVMLEALPGYQRICYEELVAYKLSILELKARQYSRNAPVIVMNEKSHSRLLSTLPFEPTDAQSRVFREIMADCTSDKAMSRLVHGDVGSGKTLVAAMVMEQFAVNGLQCAMLAPTELLARQHQRKISEFFEPLGYEVALVTGTMKKKERDEVFHKAASGAVKIFVGTHALFQKGMTYQHLALAIVDEQHRFGVDQRESLLNKAPVGLAAHELLMTATPIPRSLQQALYSDTDVSTIDSLPKGRSPITTAVLSQDRIDQVVERLRAHCTEGNQAYWVCPLVEENEVLDSTSAKKRFADLQKRLPEMKLGLLHAQMKDKEKTSAMEGFLSGEINILVATTIVEVGVDVPNATVIVIESADQLGLAQLHQLRGRVGRGSKASFCLLIHQNYPPAENAQEEERRQRSLKRLEIMRSTTNGFEIANQDLLMRGPGEFFGTNQAGKENFRFADLNRDYDLVRDAQHAAQEIFNNDMLSAYNLIMRWFPDVLAPSNGDPSDAMADVMSSRRPD